jgi:hypothetical protein
MTDPFTAMLAHAGLSLSAEDRERLERNYPVIQRWLSELRIPEARYAEPAAIYPATSRPSPSPKYPP